MFHESCIFILLTRHLCWIEIGKFESVTQSVLSGVLQIGSFHITRIECKIYFPETCLWGLLQEGRWTWTFFMFMFSGSFHELFQSSCLVGGKKNKIKNTPQNRCGCLHLTWKKRWQTSSRGWRDHNTAVSVLVCVLFHIQISANMRRSHLLSAFGYVKCAGRWSIDRWASVRLSETCACGCLSEAMTTFHSLFIAFISFGL